MAGSLDTSVQGGVNSVVNGGTFAEYGEYKYGNDNSGFIQYDGTGNGSDMGARHNPWNDKWEGLQTIDKIMGAERNLSAHLLYHLPSN